MTSHSMTVAFVLTLILTNLYFIELALELRRRERELTSAAKINRQTIDSLTLRTKDLIEQRELIIQSNNSSIEKMNTHYDKMRQDNRKLIGLLEECERVFMCTLGNYRRMKVHEAAHDAYNSAEVMVRTIREIRDGVK